MKATRDTNVVEFDGRTLCGKARRLRVDFDSSIPSQREAHYLATMYLTRLNAQSMHWLRTLAECLLEEEHLQQMETIVKGGPQ